MSDPASSAASRRRFLQFCVVGVTGVVVNLGVFELATRAMGQALDADLRFIVANMVGIGVSILTNFLLNDAWTWRDRRSAASMSWARRLGAFYLVASVGGGIQFGVGYLTRLLLRDVSLPFGLGARQDTLAILSGIGVATFANYFLNNAFTFRQQRAAPPR